MKAEIEKVFMNWSGAEQIDTPRATEEITTLIIKWLEEKVEEPIPGSLNSPFSYEAGKRKGRNQLITELIGEMR
jgi:hypothetical protein